jgi:hypothetical protein
LLHFKDFAPPYLSNLSEPLNWADARAAQKKTNANAIAHGTRPARNLRLESRFAVRERKRARSDAGSNSADRGQTFSDLQVVSLIRVPVK